MINNKIAHQGDIGEHTVVVQIDFHTADFSAKLDEFKLLVASAGLHEIAFLSGTRDFPTPKYFVGKGKAEELKEIVRTQEADLVVFNHPLSPAQVRNLETLCNCRVIDRTELILDIFAQRAQTFEGKLQVELAQLQHLLTRLVHGWTHLERQKGGIGLRGPGETQLESDRRIVRERIKSIQKRLSHVRKQRQQMRQKRLRHQMPVVSLVGYTNAGKSTLFNLLSQSDVYVADQLFATLDPTVRKVAIPSLGDVMLVDTVGFIRDLPHDLVEAFRATLEETKESDLLLHVVDANDEAKQEHIQAVNAVLKQIGAEHVAQLVVYNKIDLLIGAQSRIDTNSEHLPIHVWVSAQKGIGIELLKSAIATCITQDMVHCCLRVTPQAGEIRAQLHAIDAVIAESYDQNGDALLELKLPKNILERML